MFFRDFVNVRCQFESFQFEVGNGLGAFDGDDFIAMLSRLITLEKFPPEVGRALLWLLLQLFYCSGYRFLSVSVCSRMYLMLRSKLAMSAVRRSTSSVSSLTRMAASSLHLVSAASMMLYL